MNRRCLLLVVAILPAMVFTLAIQHTDKAASQQQVMRVLAWSPNTFTCHMYLPLIVAPSLLVNGDFEVPPPWPAQDGREEVQVAPGWQAWWFDQPPSYVQVPANCAADSVPACYWIRPEFHDSSAKVHGGLYAQKYFSFGRMHEAGLFQQVSGITPGVTLTFSVYMRAWMCDYNPSERCDRGRYSNSPTDMHLRIGIDPTGGIDPTSLNVVWSDEKSAWDEWVKFEISAVAQSDTVTVFTHSRPEWDVVRLVNEVYVDDAVLLVAP